MSNGQITAIRQASDVVQATARRVPDQHAAEEAVRTLLMWAGENPEREGLLDTPKRVAKAYKEIFRGYGMNPAEVLDRVFSEVASYDEMVVVREIKFHSHCEHHMVPFVGTAHVGYIPDRAVLGLSKIARVVEIFSTRLQTQETMTAQIAEAIDENLKPKGVAVWVEAEHMCMSMRGVRQHGASTVTSKFIGDFKGSPELQARFLSKARGRE